MYYRFPLCNMLVFFLSGSILRKEMISKFKILSKKISKHLLEKKTIAGLVKYKWGTFQASELEKNSIQTNWNRFNYI